MREQEKVAAMQSDDISDADNSKAIKALILLLVAFILGTLCLQGFNLVFAQVGKDVGSPAHASLITALPSIVLGIVCFLYGSLGDFVSLRRLVAVGLVTLFIGSIFGFVANFFFNANLWTVIIARILQTAGEQVTGSVYLVVATKYLRSSLKVIFFGIYTAGYQLSSAIGVFAAGLLSSIHWQYLFLIPSVAILFLPALLKYLPDYKAKGGKVDWIGFVIFGLASAFLTLFFSYMNWWLLLVAVLLFVGFGFYIARAQEPFVTPAFFRNRRWVTAIILILLFYFINYSVSPIFNAVGGGVYHLTTSQVSQHIVWAFVVAATVGTCSGIIVDHIGRQAAVITAASLMILGFAGAAVLVNSGLWAMTLAICVFYAGMGLLYSPVVDTVLGTLPNEQSGRGVGMNDLVMNVTASIGIAIFGGVMSNGSLSGFSVVGAHGMAANYSNLLLICACVVAVGLVYYVLVRKSLYVNADETAK